MKNNSYTTFITSGLAFGFPTTLLCMTLIGGFNGIIMEFFTWMVASALFGLVTGLVFKKENLSLPVAITIHCVCCLLIATSAATIIGYADGFFTVLLGVLPVFVVVYVVIYAICYLLMKCEAKRVNELLESK